MSYWQRFPEGDGGRGASWGNPKEADKVLLARLLGSPHLDST